MKILNQTSIINFKGKEYEVFVDISSLEKMNWSWESLIFPEDVTTIAYVADSNKNITSLEINGDVEIYKNGKLVDLDKVSELALTKEIYDDKYEIELKNDFFIIHKVYYNNDCYNEIERNEFRTDINSVEELTKLLLDSHISYFSQN